MGGVVNVQNPSGCLSISALGPLQKFTRTLVASGALKRMSTRELLSTFGYCASRTFDVAGLKLPASCAKQKLAANSIHTPANFIFSLRKRLLANLSRSPANE